MARINEIIDKVRAYHPNADTSVITKAYVYSAKVHAGQTRMSGAPYLSHPLAVADILADMKLDVATICASLMHDTVEDTETTLEDISALLGPEIAALVDGVTKISQLATNTKSTRQVESLRKMILAMAEDIRVILIKLADRLHNMRTLGYLPERKQKSIAEETLYIYAPMAHRLGVRRWQVELEDLAFFYLEPEDYQRIKEGVATRKAERQRFVEEVKQIVIKAMADAGIECRVDGRAKHFYSINEKLKRRNVSLEELYDLEAIRVIVNSVKDCYEALGLVHSMWKPVPGRFRDYIALPKSNMYRSLHTAVVGPAGQRMEVQIRTEEMHRIAEEGIAAHWRYKEAGASNEDEQTRFAWLRRLLEWQRETQDPREYIDTLRMDLFPDEIFVFTPTGEVKELPRGATPIDFAYSIHTEVGHQCVGAKVNGRMVPLRHELKTGDQVEVMTQNSHTPSKDWLKFAASNRARAKLRAYFRDQERERSVSMGRDLLDRELKKRSLNLNTVIREGKLEQLASDFSFKDIDRLLAAVAYGKISPKLIANRIQPQAEEEKGAGGIIKRSLGRLKRRPTAGVRVKGVDDVLVRYGKCCNPLPGDAVVGFITRGRGVTVHNRNCPSLASVDPERLVDLQWDVPENQLWQTRILVETDGHTGVLADLASVLKKREIAILEADVRTLEDRRGLSEFVIEVHDAKQLKRVLSDLKNIKGVQAVRRQGIPG